MLNWSFYYFTYRFYAKGMPGCIGLVDGTHIVIKKPKNTVEHTYYSVRKSCHTKNVQIVSDIFQLQITHLTYCKYFFLFQICDADMEILSINPRYGGSSHDSFVWNNSYIKQLLKNEYSNGARNSFLLGKYTEYL